MQGGFGGMEIRLGIEVACVRANKGNLGTDLVGLGTLGIKKAAKQKSRSKENLDRQEAQRSSHVNIPFSYCCL